MVTPLGPESLALMNLRTLLSNSSDFQTWVSAADSTEALDSILYASTQGQDIPHPIAMVKFGTSFSSAADSIDSGHNFSGTENGSLNLVFEDSTDQGEDSEADNLVTFMNTVGQIIEDIWTSQVTRLIQHHN